MREGATVILTYQDLDQVLFQVEPLNLTPWCETKGGEGAGPGDGHLLGRLRLPGVLGRHLLLGGRQAFTSLDPNDLSRFKV